MPVAVGTGGKTVAFRAELSTTDIAIADNVDIKLSLDKLI